MTDFYTDLGAALLSDVFPLFAIGGPSWTRTRTTGNTPAADGTTTSGSVTLYVLDNRSRRAVGLTGAPLLDTAWVAYGATSVDLQAGDTITDGTYTYAVIGKPETHQGFMAAPLEARP